MNEMLDSLLAADEPAPVTAHNENTRSPFLIVADHAGNSMPRVLGRARNLGRPICFLNAIAVSSPKCNSAA
jgi:hypothetical protein